MNLKLMGMAGLLAMVLGCDREAPQPAAAPAAPAAVPTAAPVPAAAPAAAVPAPTVYEEGATYNGTVLAEPPSVTDYVENGGAYYYLNPTLNVWVHAHRPADWHPREGVHVYHGWAEHPKFAPKEGAREREERK